MDRLKVIFLLLILLCTNAYAQTDDAVSRGQVYVIDDFSKYLYSNKNPFDIDKGNAIVAQNVRSNTNVGSLNKRSVMKSYGKISSSSAVKTVYKFYKSDGNKYLIASADESIYYGNDSTGVITTIQDGLTTGKRFSCVTYQDNAICSNGFDNIKKWDGSCSTTSDVDGARSAGACMADLNSAYVEQNTGTNLDATSWYQYRVAFFDGTNYSYSSSKSNPIQTGSTLKGTTLTDIPLGPSGTTQRIIYRTEGNASRSAVEADTDYYKLATISDNSTRTYNDDIADATILADDTPVWSTVSAGIDATPPKGKFLIIINERLWVANDPSVDNGKSFVYFSETYRPGYILASSNYFSIRPDDGDEITFVDVLLGKLVVGKTNTIQKIYIEDTSTSNWYVTDPFSFIGCAAPYSEVVTPLGIFYVGRDNIYRFNGQSSENISERVNDILRDLNQVNINEVAGEFFKNEYHVAYTSTESGSAINDRVLIFDTTNDSYFIDTKGIDSFSVANAGTDYGALIMGTSALDGSIYLAAQTPTSLAYRKKSEIQGGTVDSTDILGTENNPWIELGFGKIWSEMTGTWADQTGSWDVPSQTGYWYSPVVNINANNFEKLYWNENLGPGGDVTFAIRTGASEAATESASWSSEFTNPSGSDISGVAADDYIQLRATLTTDNYTSTPVVFLADNYVINLAYSQQGSNGETAFLTFWQSGYNTFEGDGYEKRIRAIDVYYTGTAGTITFGLKDADGNVDTSFDIDLSKAPVNDDYLNNEYRGEGEVKRRHWEPPVNSSDTPTPIGYEWQFSVSESGVDEWSIKKIVVIYDVLPRHEP